MRLVEGKRAKTKSRVATKSKAKAKTTTKKKTAAKKKPKKISKKRQAEIDQLILEHRENGRKLARSLLRRWRARMNPEEIDSIVDLTLCEAAQRYSKEHGASFMTFLFYHLRGHLVRAVANAVNSNNVVLAFGKRNGHETSDPMTSIEENLRLFLPECASFGVHEVEGPEQILLRKENISICQKAYDALDELEREVILRSFADEEPLVNIARSLGYSRCHISRVKKRAIDRLEEILQADFQNADAKENAPATRAASATRKPRRRRSRRRVIQPRHAATGKEKIAN